MRNNLLTVVVYDITDNTSRLHLIKKLQFFGLKRIQKSVFIGYLEMKDRLDLAEDLDKFLSNETDSIILLPLCGNCKDSIFLVGDADIPQNDLTYRFL